MSTLEPASEETLGTTSDGIGRPGNARLAKPLPLRLQPLDPTNAPSPLCRSPSPSRLLLPLNASTPPGATAVTNEAPSFLCLLQRHVTDSDHADMSDDNPTIGEPISGCYVATESSNASRIFSEGLLPRPGECNICDSTSCPDNRRASVVAEEYTNGVSTSHYRRPLLKKSVSSPHPGTSGGGNAKKRPRVDSMRTTQLANKRIQLTQASLAASQ